MSKARTRLLDGSYNSPRSLPLRLRPSRGGLAGVRRWTHKVRLMLGLRPPGSGTNRVTWYTTIHNREWIATTGHCLPWLAYVNVSFIFYQKHYYCNYYYYHIIFWKWNPTIKGRSSNFHLNIINVQCSRWIFSKCCIVLKQY